jgi:hypothetical protein
MTENLKDNPKKYIKIFFNDFKYEGYLMWEDDIVYCINDIKEGRIKIPKANSVCKEVEK